MLLGLYAAESVVAFVKKSRKRPKKQKGGTYPGRRGEAKQPLELGSKCTRGFKKTWKALLARRSLHSENRLSGVTSCSHVP